MPESLIAAANAALAGGAPICSMLPRPGKSARAPELGRLLEQYPQIRDVHFWAQLPGEPVASGQRRIEYMARHVLPRVRERL